MDEILTDRVIRGHILIRENSTSQSGKVRVAEAQGSYETKDKYEASRSRLVAP